MATVNISGDNGHLVLAVGLRWKFPIFLSVGYNVMCESIKPDTTVRLNTPILNLFRDFIMKGFKFNQMFFIKLLKWQYGWYSSFCDYDTLYLLMWWFLNNPYIHGRNAFFVIVNNLFNVSWIWFARILLMPFHANLWGRSMAILWFYFCINLLVHV